MRHQDGLATLAFRDPMFDSVPNVLNCGATLQVSHQGALFDPRAFKPSTNLLGFFCKTTKKVIRIHCQDSIGAKIIL
jgi:hypothetical protein